MVDFFSDFQLGSLSELPVAPSPATSAADAAIARLAGGGLVVGYVVDRAIMVQRYDANGEKAGAPAALTAGGSTVINSEPSVTGLPGGGYAVTWVDTSAHVAVQVFDANGVATTGVFGVGTPSNYQQQPSITTLTNGDLVVAWTFNSTASSIRAQIFHANGQPASGEIVATSSPYHNSYYPQIAALTGGGFVLSWSGSFDSEGGGTVRAQSYDSAGTAQGSLVRVANLVSYHENSGESVAALPTGGYVLTWVESGDVGGVPSKVMAQLRGADGSAAGDRFQVNTSVTYNAGQATVAVLDDGGFLVTWKSDVPGTGPNYFQIGDIEAQLFDAAGNKVGSEFQVNPITPNGQDLPLVTGFGTGDVAIVWHSFPSLGQETLESRMLYSVTNGTNGPDTLTGTSGVDYLRGLGNDDSLDGGAGADVMIGGAGNDIYHVDNIGDQVLEAVGEGVDRVVASVSWTMAAGQEIEQLSVANMAGTNAVNLSGNEFANKLAGNDGANTLNGGGGNDKLVGAGGDDILDGGTGADQMQGGTGSDSYIVDNVGDTVFEANSGGGDYDTVMATVSWSLGAGQEVERLRAGPGTDSINLTGNDYAQKMQGNDGDNILTGGGGNDVLIGGGGADVLIGGTGLDKLTGGLGADTFVFEHGGQMDQIVDFAVGTDKADLTAFGLTWQDVQAAMTESNGNTILTLGGGDSVIFAGVSEASLSASDFLLGGGNLGNTLQSDMWDGGRDDMLHAQIRTSHAMFEWHLL
ncbi:MAG: calcium-binding protein [Sphingomonas sp.]